MRYFIILMVGGIDGWGVKHGEAYDERGVRIFDRTVEISSLVNRTTVLRYSSTPPYFSSSSERNASMVSGLYANIQKNAPTTGPGYRITGRRTY